MTDKELKRLNRTELLQLLMNQVRETEQLQAKVQELTEQIQKHEITCQNAGTLAEAALALNGVFQAADEAAQKYVQEMADRAAKQEQELQAKAEEAKEQANKLLADATDSADITREKAETYLADAKAKAEAILAEAGESAAKVREEATNCLDDAKSQKEQLLEQAKTEAETCVAKAKEEAEACVAKAKTESEEYWNRVNDQIRTLLEGQETLKAMFETVGKNHTV